MDFWELTKLLFRRWYLSVPMLVLSFVIAIFTGASVKPDYKATQHLQIIPPVTTDYPGLIRPHNPWSDLGPVAIGNAAMISVNDNSVLAQLTAKKLSDTFTISIDPRSPIVTVEVIGRSPKQATDTADTIAKLFEQKVSSLQTTYGVQQDQLITTHGLDTGTNVVKVTSKVKRALAVIGGVGMLVTAAVTIGLDALLRSRSGRRGGTVEVKPGADGASKRARPASDWRDPDPETVAIRLPGNANGGANGHAMTSSRAGAGSADPSAERNRWFARKPQAGTEATITLPMENSRAGRGGRERQQ